MLTLDTLLAVVCESLCYLRLFDPPGDPPDSRPTETAFVYILYTNDYKYSLGPTLYGRPGYSVEMKGPTRCS